MFDRLLNTPLALYWRVVYIQSHLSIADKVFAISRCPLHAGFTGSKFRKFRSFWTIRKIRSVEKLCPLYRVFSERVWPWFDRFHEKMSAVTRCYYSMSVINRFDRVMLLYIFATIRLLKQIILVTWVVFYFQHDLISCNLKIRDYLQEIF